MPDSARSNRSCAVRDGAWAGLVAAVLSSAPGLLWVLHTGEPWWQPIQLIATLLGAGRPTSFDPAMFLLGGAIHVALSLGYGVGFALATRRVRAPMTLLGMGLASGLAIFAVNFRVAASFGLFETLQRGTSEPVELCAHAAFGLVVASVLAFRWRRRPVPPAVP